MKFLAIEHEIPSKEVSNEAILEAVRRESGPHLGTEDLEILLDLTADCFKAAGTRIRYHRDIGETAFDIALRAGRKAIENAGIDRSEIDLLLYVGIGRGMLEPASANIFQDALELTNATCFDILDACASWARALQMAHTYTKAGLYKNVMILNAEFLGRDALRYELKTLGEFAYWHPSVTIGEAATATIITASAEDNFTCDFRTWGAQRDLCFVNLPNFAEYFGKPVNSRLQLDEPQFVSYGVKLLDFAAHKLIEHYQSEKKRDSAVPDVVFGHAASDGMSRYVMEHCDIDPKKYVFSHELFANTVSASVPIAMSHALRNGLLKNGDDVLIMIGSAGVSTGILTFTYQD